MKKILVVVDMQNDFINGALGTKEAEAIVPNVVEKIKNFDGEIFVTYDTHQNNYMNTREGKYLPVSHCIEGTDGWNLNVDIENALVKRGKINRVYKPTFGSTKLVDIFKEMCDKVQSESGENVEVTLVGLCSDICVVSNAMLLKANFPEMDIIVDASCCAGVTPESHKAALITMKSCQIDVIGE